MRRAGLQHRLRPAPLLTTQPHARPVEVQIREFRRQDVDALYFMDQRCYAPACRASFSHLLKTLLQPQAMALVAEAPALPRSPGLLGATVLRVESEAQRLFIVALMVEPGFRRAGLGTALLGHAAHLAAAQQQQALVVPVETENAEARAFLLARGFEDTGQAEPYFPDAQVGTLWRRPIAEESTA